MYAQYKKQVEAALQLQANSSNQTIKEKEIEKNEAMTERTEAETNNTRLEYAKKHPHLREQFDMIDEFLEEMKVDPMLERGRFSNPEGLEQLYFSNFNVVDQPIFWEYLSRTDAAKLFKASYEALMDSAGVSCLSSFTKEIQKKNSTCFFKLVYLCGILCRSFTVPVFSKQVCDSGLMRHFVEDLKVMKVDEIKRKDGKTNFNLIFNSVMPTIHNCTSNPENRPQLRKYGTVTHLLPFLKSENKDVKLTVLIMLSKLVDDTENDHILADENSFEVIFEMLESAWTNSNHVASAWHVGALIDGMACLAKNDSNKTVLYEKGAVPTLTKVLKDGQGREKQSAAKCIWELAFDKKISKELAMNKELLELLTKLKSSPKDYVRKAAKGALWEINQQERVKSPSSHADRLSRGHVMISYQWDDQKMLKKLKESLTQNHYRVWMDVDQMAGSTLEAMAKAVENAAVVLVCMSEKYKLSQNCRSEAGYAFSTKKDIIPLVMQRSYIPDGWLGILRESKLFFDFSGKYPYDSKLQDLLRELGQRGKWQPNGTTAAGGDVYASPPIQAGSRDVIRANLLSSWSDKDVNNWLTKIGLQNKPSLKVLSGPNLIFLRELSRQAPEFFYNYLKTELDLKSLDDLRAFCTAFGEL